MAALQSNQQISFADNIGEQGFLSYLSSLGEKPSTTLRIFDRGEYYTCHNEDAKFAAKEFFKTSTVIKELGKGSTKVPSVVLSKMNFETFLRDLLLTWQYRVELYRNKASKSNQWELIGKGSPGNLQQFEEILFNNIDMSASAIVMSLRLATDANGQRVVGAAFADAALQIFNVCEFSDNDQFSNVETLLMQVGPKECLIQRQDLSAEGSKLKIVLERSNVLVTEAKKADFSSKDSTQDLDRLLKSNSCGSAARRELDLPHAVCCLSSIIKYLELLSDDSAFHQYTLKSFDLSQYMRLDAAAVRALNILPSFTDGGNKTMCLSGLLNLCKTTPGQRLLGQWVKQPLMDAKRIEERLDIVDIFFNNGDIRLSVQDGSLRRIPDLSRLSKKFQQKRANLQDCVRVYQAIRQLPHLLTTLKKYDGEHKVIMEEVFCKPFQDAVNDFSKFMELVETTVDLDEVENHEYLIKAEFDESLQECKDNLDYVVTQLESELSKAARDLGLEKGKTIKLESNSQLGHYFRVTLKEEKALRNNKRYTTVETRKDGVRFVNSSLKSLGIEYKSHKATYSELQTQLANEVIKIAAGYSDPLQTLSDQIAYLDVLLSFATVASQAPTPYVRPVVHPKGEGKIVLKGSRHPCLEAQDDVSFIANDVSLIKDDQEFLIITGPNMGGKSTYIRQIGLITLMAQIGSFVPCDQAEISIVDSILARVGAGDSQLKGVSTFMSEMLETASILRAATKDSLIIIDELGRGTSTYDGFGLAWAISEHISTSIKSFCVFATHFHELTSLADEISTVRNFHVTALTSKEQLTLLYKVKPGVCDQSFGIHVAEIAHFPKHVVDFAKEKAKELEDFQVLSNDKECDQFNEASSGEPVAKKRRSEKKEGDEIIRKFVEKFRSLHEANLNDDELVKSVTAIKEEVLACGNQYVIDIINK